MKRFLRMVKTDINRGIFCKFPMFIMIFVISVIYVNEFYIKVIKQFKRGIVDGNIGFGDCIIYFFRGMKEYMPGEPFEIPIQFMIINILIAYMIGYFPVRDIKEYGKNILVRSKSRLEWWMSKCIWNISIVTVFYIVLYLGMIVGTLLFSDGKFVWSLTLNRSITNVLLGPINSNVDINTLVITIIILTYATTLAMSMVQMTLSLITSPIVSFVIVIVMNIMSAYYMKWFMPGNYLMTYRNILINSNGVQFQTSIIIDMLLLIFSAVSGYIYFRKYEII